MIITLLKVRDEAKLFVINKKLHIKYDASLKRIAM